MSNCYKCILVAQIDASRQFFRYVTWTAQTCAVKVWQEIQHLYGSNQSLSLGFDWIQDMKTEKESWKPLACLDN